MDLDFCIAARRDTRHFLSDPVPEEVLANALQAAHKAPSVGLSEPWRFVIVQSVQARKDLLASFHMMKTSANETNAANLTWLKRVQKFIGLLHSQWQTDWYPQKRTPQSPAEWQP